MIIFDVRKEFEARFEFEMNQVTHPGAYGGLPPVEIVPEEQLFACDVFVFCASRGVPPISETKMDVRMAQYGNGSRTRKADWTAALGQALDVAAKGLDVPDIDSYTGLMHTLFTLEDRYGLEVCECEDEVHLRVHIHKGRDAAELHRMLTAWGAVVAKLKAGEITKEEYDRWRYRYPELDTSGQWHKITPSQELRDLLLEEMQHE